MICPKCNKRKRKTYLATDGERKLRKTCNPCSQSLETLRAQRKRIRDRRDFPYRAYKKGFCEKCGFVPEHPVQLDVDHMDGNNKNHDPANLQTLCANCHRLKTLLSKDGPYRTIDSP